MTESDEEVIAAAERFGISGLLTKEQFDHLVALARRGAAIPDEPTYDMLMAAGPSQHSFYTTMAYRAMIAKALEPRT